MKTLLTMTVVSGLLLANGVFAADSKFLAGIGDVQVVRQEATRTHGKNSMQTGDIVHTRQGANASFLCNRCVVYMGENSTVELIKLAKDPVIKIHQGSFRVIVLSNSSLPVVVGATTGILSSGVFDLNCDPDAFRLASVHGIANLQFSSRESLHSVAKASYATTDTTVETGDQVIIENDGTATQGSITEADLAEGSNSIDIEGLQRQSVAIAQQQSPPTRSQATRAPAPEPTPRPARNNADSQNNVATAPGFGFGFGAFSSASSIGASGSLNADFNQKAIDGVLTATTSGVAEAVVDGNRLAAGDVFPGTIRLVTSENQTRNAVGLNGDLATPQYWSIATFTSMNPADYIIDFSGVSLSPVAGSLIPLSDGRMLVQYPALPNGSTDPIIPPTATAGFGAIFLGANPEDNISLGVGTIPLDDTQAVLNNKLTYALGQVVLREDNGNLVVGIRRSDQDRLIIGDLNSQSPPPDQVSANRDVIYRKATGDDASRADANGEIIPGNTILPQSFNRPVGLSSLGPNGKEAVTRIMASSLQDFARRTGQTRFVADGKIIDISGAPNQP